MPRKRTVGAAPPTELDDDFFEHLGDNDDRKRIGKKNISSSRNLTKGELATRICLGVVALTSLVALTTGIWAFTRVWQTEPQTFDSLEVLEVLTTADLEISGDVVLSDEAVSTIQTKLSLTTGADGYQCWDLNLDHLCNTTTEDQNGDGACNITDCQGVDGVIGVNGTDGVDGVNGTNGVDGVNGTNGADGVNNFPADIFKIRMPETARFLEHRQGALFNGTEGDAHFLVVDAGADHHDRREHHRRIDAQYVRSASRPNIHSSFDRIRPRLSDPFPPHFDDRWYRHHPRFE